MGWGMEGVGWGWVLDVDADRDNKFLHSEKKFVALFYSNGVDLDKNIPSFLFVKILPPDPGLVMLLLLLLLLIFFRCRSRARQ